MSLNIATFISTCFIGNKIPAPGTVTSFLTCLITYFCYNHALILNGGLQFKQNIFLYLLGISILFVIGALCSQAYSNYYKIADPSEIVIDEVVGQLLTLVLVWYVAIPTKAVALAKISFTYHLLSYWFLPFILFRFFDILKPGLVSFADQNIKGGVGIMLDDVIAALHAVAAQLVLMYIIS